MSNNSLSNSSNNKVFKARRICTKLITKSMILNKRWSNEDKKRWDFAIASICKLENRQRQ